MSSYCSLWALIQYDWCPYNKREIWRQTHREERPREVGRRGWRDVATSQDMPGAPRIWEKQEGFSSREPCWREATLDHLGFVWASGLQTVRGDISGVLRPPPPKLWGFVLQPPGTNTQESQSCENVCLRGHKTAVLLFLTSRSHSSPHPDPSCGPDAVLPVWVRMWPWSSQGLEKALPQMTQMQGSVCVRMCILRAPRLEYSLSQYLQVKQR